MQLMRTLEHRRHPDWRRITALAARDVADLWESAEHPGVVLTAVYRRVNRETETVDAYRREKEAANALAEDYWQRHQVPLEDLFSRLVYAVAGNLLDAGLDADPARLFSDFQAAVDAGFGRDDRAQFFRRLPFRATIAYLFDNAGEAVFDREVVRSLRHHGYRVIAIVRGRPFLNDITREEALSLGIDRVATELLDTGSDACGWDWTSPGSRAKAALETADGIIAKGIANLETMSHVDLKKPALFLFRAKCPPSARLAGVQWNQNAAWLQA